MICPKCGGDTFIMVSNGSVEWRGVENGVLILEWKKLINFIL